MSHLLPPCSSWLDILALPHLKPKGKELSSGCLIRSSEEIHAWNNNYIIRNLISVLKRLLNAK